MLSGGVFFGDVLDLISQVVHKCLTRSCMRSLDCPILVHFVNLDKKNVNAPILIELLLGIVHFYRVVLT